MIIAIDPGLKGGIAWKKNGKVEAIKMPDTPKAIKDFLDKVRIDIDPCGCGLAWHTPLEVKCYLEKVNAMPKQGCKGTWTFAEHYGTLKAILLCLEIPMVEVSPQKWQKAIGASRPSLPDNATPSQKEANKREGKKNIKQIVEARYPHLRITLNTADALGILMFAEKEERK